MLFEDEIVERENANWRICQDGLGVELIRRTEMSDIYERLPPFLAHIPMVDIIALKKALLLQELGPERGGTATLVEAYLRLLQAGLIKVPNNCSCPCTCAANSAEQKPETTSSCARRATA